MAAPTGPSKPHYITTVCWCVRSADICFTRVQGRITIDMVTAAPWVELAAALLNACCLHKSMQSRSYLSAVPCCTEGHGRTPGLQPRPRRKCSQGKELTTRAKLWHPVVHSISLNIKERRGAVLAAKSRCAAALCPCARLSTDGLIAEARLTSDSVQAFPRSQGQSSLRL